MGFNAIIGMLVLTLVMFGVVAAVGYVLFTSSNAD